MISRIVSRTYSVESYPRMNFVSLGRDSESRSSSFSTPVMTSSALDPAACEMRSIPAGDPSNELLNA